MARKCDCGRTLNEPFCDGSHTLTEQQYLERAVQLEEELEQYKDNKDKE